MSDVILGAFAVLAGASFCYRGYLGMRLLIPTALGGATAITAGLMLFAGALDSDDLSRADVVARIETDWWWYVIYLTFAVTGIISQTRSAQQLHLSMQEAWKQPTPTER